MFVDVCDNFDKINACNFVEIVCKKDFFRFTRDFAELASVNNSIHVPAYKNKITHTMRQQQNSSRKIPEIS